VFSGFALHEGRLLFITTPRYKAAGLAFIGAKRGPWRQKKRTDQAQGLVKEGRLGLQG
jgi:hypothetical protein